MTDEDHGWQDFDPADPTTHPRDDLIEVLLKDGRVVVGGYIRALGGLRSVYGTSINRPVRKEEFVRWRYLPMRPLDLNPKKK